MTLFLCFIIIIHHQSQSQVRVLAQSCPRHLLPVSVDLNVLPVDLRQGPEEFPHHVLGKLPLLCGDLSLRQLDVPGEVRFLEKIPAGAESCHNDF